jgi:YD repeat-containing protein
MNVWILCAWMVPLARGEDAPPPAPVAATTPAAEVAPARELRDTWDAQRRLVRQVEVVGEQLVAETTWVYDDGGRPVTRTTTRGASSEVQRWTYDADGREILRVQWADGAEVGRVATTWESGRVVEVADTQRGATTRTRTTYDGQGRVTRVETTGPDGAVEVRTATFAEAPPPPPEGVPIQLTLSGGLSYQTDVELFTVSGGFSVDRKPVVEAFGKDPLEVHATVSYAYGRSRKEVVNNALHGRFSIDLNLVAPRVTPFLFVDVDRNTAFNQNIDLEIAPVGVKVDLVPREIMKLDFSFAPVINYRSVAIPAGSSTVCNGADVSGPAACDFLKVRGSFRLRAGYKAKHWDVSDFVEYLPNLTPKEVTFVEGLSRDSITRNTFLFNVKLTDWLGLSESFVFTRDPTLAAQADCGANPDALLCDGLVFNTATNLNFTWSVKPR